MKFYFSCQHNGSPSTENSVAGDKSTRSVAKSPTKEQLKAMLKKYQQAANLSEKSIDYYTSLIHKHYDHLRPNRRIISRTWRYSP